MADRGKPTKKKAECRCCGKEIYVSHTRFKRHDCFCNSCMDRDWYVQDPGIFKWTFDPFDNFFVPGDDINPNSALVTGI